MSTVWINGVGKYGLVADVPPREIPLEAWSAVQNMRFHDEVAERVQGMLSVFDTPSIVPHNLLPWKSATTQYGFYGDATTLWRTDGTASANVTRASGPYTASAWRGDVLNEVPILNNGSDVPQQWDAGTGLFVDLANWPVGWFCAGIRSFKNYLVAFGLTRNTIAYPWEIRWSASVEAGGVPSTWVAAPGNDAGNTNALAGTTDHIVDMIQLGNNNVIYKNNSVWAQQWIGGNQIFAHRVAFREFGMISANCAREVFSKQVVLTQDDVVIHNLVEAKSLVDNGVRRLLFNSLDATNVDKCCVELSVSHSELLIGIPEVGSGGFITKLFVWNWKSNTWSVCDVLPSTYFATMSLSSTGQNFVVGPLIPLDAPAIPLDTNTFAMDQYPVPTGGSVIFALADKGFAQNAAGYTIQGNSYSSVLERTGLQIAGQDRFGNPVLNPHAVKMVTEVLPLVDADAGVVVDVQVGTQSHIGGAVQWGAKKAFDPTVDTKVDVLATGKLLGVRFSSSSGGRWRLSGYGLTIKKVAEF